MNALVIIPPILALPASLADAEMAAALSFAEHEKSAGTRRAYASDFGIFTAWCDARGLSPMPASAGTAARFLSSQATAGLKSSTIGRRAAAIAHFHKMNGLSYAKERKATRAVLTAKTKGTAPLASKRVP